MCLSVLFEIPQTHDCAHLDYHPYPTTPADNSGNYPIRYWSRLNGGHMT